MTSITSTIENINRIPVKGSKRELPEFYKPVLEQYKTHLESLDLSQIARSERVFRCTLALIKIQGIFGNCNLDLSKEQVSMVKDSITEYSESHVRKTIKVLCELMKYLGHTNWYSEIYNTAPKVAPWLKGHEGEFLFEDELERYRHIQEEKGLKAATINKECSRIRMICSALNKEAGITALEDIDRNCFDLLENLTSPLSEKVRADYVELLKKFLRETIGKDFYALDRERILIDSLPPGIETETFLSEVENFLRIQRRRGLCKDSIDNNRHCLFIAYRALTQRFGKLFPEKVTKEMIWDVRDDFPVKDRTIRTYLSAFGRMVETLHGNNPYLEADMLWSNEEYERTFIDRNQWKVLLKNADRIQRMIMILAASLGLRRSEIVRLKLSDYDGCRITINGKGTGRHGKLVKLTVDDILKQEIERYLEYRQGLLNDHIDLTEGTFIVKIHGNRILPATRNRVSRMMDELSKKTGIVFACHTLRRFFANCLLDDGVPLEIVQSMMRHSNLSTTMIYLQDNKKLKTEAYRRLNGSILS